MASCSHNAPNIVIDTNVETIELIDSPDIVMNDVTNVPSTSSGILDLEFNQFLNYDHVNNECVELLEKITTRIDSHLFDHDYSGTITNESSNFENSNDHRDLENTMTGSNNIPSTSHTLPLETHQMQNNYSEHNYSRSSTTTRPIKLTNHYSELNHNRTAGRSSNNEILNNRQYNTNSNLNQSNANDIRNIDTIPENYIGEMNVICQHCHAKHFIGEKVANKINSFNNCCRHGEVSLQTYPKFPSLLKSLFERSHNKSQNFLERIRDFNSSFSFASFNANLTDLSSQRRGPYCFKIQGQIYYQMNTSLYPLSNKSPSYGQLFIFDSSEAMAFRS